MYVLRRPSDGLICRQSCLGRLEAEDLRKTYGRMACMPYPSSCRSTFSRPLIKVSASDGKIKWTHTVVTPAPGASQCARRQLDVVVAVLELGPASLWTGEGRSLGGPAREFDRQRGHVGQADRRIRVALACSDVDTPGGRQAPSRFADLRWRRRRREDATGRLHVE